MAGWQRSQASKSCWFTRQLRRGRDVFAALPDAGQIEPVALNDRVVCSDREHPVDDDVVRNEVHEHRELDGDGAIAAVLVRADTWNQVQALGAFASESSAVIGPSDEVL